MPRPAIRQTLSIFAALALHSVIEEPVKTAVGRLIARGDVWRVGYQAGYDRGFEEGRRLIPLTRVDDGHNPPGRARRSS